jgi:hypothetical protein
MTMKCTSALIATTLAASLSGVVSADTLQPMQGGTYILSEWTASVHYTDTDGSYEMVITLAPLNGDKPVPIRFTAALGPGQNNTVEIGSFDTNVDPTVLEIERVDDGLSVNAPVTATLSAAGVR